MNVYDQAKEIASKEGEQAFNKFLKVLIASFQVGYHPDKIGDKLEGLSKEKTKEKIKFATPVLELLQDKNLINTFYRSQN